MPYNPAALDPMTGRNLPDFNVLYAVFDALIDFEPQTLELKPGLAKILDVQRPEDAGARTRRWREFPRRHAVQRRGRQVQPRALQERSALERESRHRVGRQRRGHRQEPGDAEAQPAQRRPADHPDQPDRPDRLAQVRCRTRAATSTARRSAPARSSSSAGRTTTASCWCATRTTGSPGCPISTASTSRSSTN